MPPFPRLTTVPLFSKLVRQCRQNIAASASQHAGRPLTAEELRKTPEQYFDGGKTQWIQKFKGAVIPGLHNDPQFAKYFRKFPYSEQYAEKSYKETFVDTAIDIATQVYVSAEGKAVDFDEWRGV
jgi:hypothetical protein